LARLFGGCRLAAANMAILSMKRVIFTASARDFDALPPPARKAISRALNRYAGSGEGDKKLRDRDGCRLRWLLSRDLHRGPPIEIAKKRRALNINPQIIKAPDGSELVVMTRSQSPAISRAAKSKERPPRFAKSPPHSKLSQNGSALRAVRSAALTVPMPNR
jgi:hypothetical protein